MNKLKKLFIPLMALALLTLCACGSAASAPTDPPAAADSPDVTLAPSDTGTFSGFTSVDMDGNAVDSGVLSEHELTMINVWGTFCGPCISEMPELAQLSADYADKGVQLIGVIVDATENNGVWSKDILDAAREILSDAGAEYLQIMPSESLNSLALSEVYAVPTTFFVDSDGNILGEPYVGSRDYNDWSQIIDSFLAAA